MMDIFRGYEHGPNYSIPTHLRRRNTHSGESLVLQNLQGSGSRQLLVLVLLLLMMMFEHLLVTCVHGVALGRRCHSLHACSTRAYIPAARTARRNSSCSAAR